MKLKLDENGHVVVQEGKPVYVHEDGKEMPFDAAQLPVRISLKNLQHLQKNLSKLSLKDSEEFFYKQLFPPKSHIGKLHITSANAHEQPF